MRRLLRENVQEDTIFEREKDIPSTSDRYSLHHPFEFDLILNLIFQAKKKSKLKKYNSEKEEG